MAQPTPQPKKGLPDLFGGPAVKICDVSQDFFSEADKRVALTDFIVVRFERLPDREALDEQGFLRPMSWDKAIRTEDRGISKQTAMEKIRQLNLETQTVLNKKNALPPELMRQIERAHNEYRKSDPDLANYEWVIAQIDQYLKKLKDAAHSNPPVAPGRCRCFRIATIYCYSETKKRCHCKKPKHGAKYERSFVTVYFKRTPKPDADVTFMWEEKKKAMEAACRPPPAPAPAPAPTTKPGPDAKPTGQPPAPKPQQPAPMPPQNKPPAPHPHPQPAPPAPPVPPPHRMRPEPDSDCTTFCSHTTQPSDSSHTSYTHYPHEQRFPFPGPHHRHHHNRSDPIDRDQLADIIADVRREAFQQGQRAARRARPRSRPRFCVCVNFPDCGCEDVEVRMDNISLNGSDDDEHRRHHRRRNRNRDGGGGWPQRRVPKQQGSILSHDDFALDSSSSSTEGDGGEWRGAYWGRRF